jgi:predicted TIM-barrel fold metal-dependent hydrolase
LRIALSGATNDFPPVPVIDAHVHLYPPELNRDPAEWAAAHDEPHWATLCTRKRKNGRPVQGFPSLIRLLQTMDAAGVDRAVLLGWYWETHESCVAQNRFYADCIHAHPDRLSAFAAVQPAAGAAALTEIWRARGEGLAGLGELSPHSQGIPMEDPRLLAVLALAGELGLPVNFHVTDPAPTTGNYPGRVETPLADFSGMAKAFPAVNFILAHWGGCFWRHGVRMPDNVYFDTAASPLLYEPAVFGEAVRACGEDRVLWGTDYPLDLYPRDDARETMAEFLIQASEALPASVSENVLGGNIARLLCLAPGS